MAGYSKDVPRRIQDTNMYTNIDLVADPGWDLLDQDSTRDQKNRIRIRHLGKLGSGGEELKLTFKFILYVKIIEIVK